MSAMSSRDDVFRPLADFLPGTVRGSLGAHESGPADALWRLWRAVAEPAVVRHTRSLRLAGDTLVVHVSAPVWAHTLRHSETTLVRLLRQRGQATLRHLRPRVAPTSMPAEPRPEPKPALSSEVARLLRVTAADIEDDALRHALERLSRHTSDG